MSSKGEERESRKSKVVDKGEEKPAGDRKSMLTEVKAAAAHKELNKEIAKEQKLKPVETKDKAAPQIDPDTKLREAPQKKVFEEIAKEAKKLKHVDEKERRDSSAPKIDPDAKLREAPQKKLLDEVKKEHKLKPVDKDKEKEKKKEEKEAKEKKKKEEKEAKKEEKKEEKKVEKGKFFPIKLSMPAAPEPEREEAAMNSPRRKKDAVKAQEKKEKDEKEAKEKKEKEEKKKAKKNKEEDTSEDQSQSESSSSQTPSAPAPAFVTQVQRPGTKLPLKVSKTREKDDGREDAQMNSPRRAKTKPQEKVEETPALLPPLSKEHKGRKCLVLDLDETLVHSSFHEVDKFDFKLVIEIEKRKHTLWVAKRPYVDEFLKAMAEIYEVVVFTASLAVYANAVMDLLDPHGYVHHRLFRDSCTQYKGSYIKDMGRMGRDMKRIMILDNSPHSYAFNPNLGVPCESWFDDYADFELLTLAKVFEDLAGDDVKDLSVELEKIFGAPEDVLAEIDAAYEENQ